jgi:hypothetical protein
MRRLVRPLLVLVLGAGLGTTTAAPAAGSRAIVITVRSVTTASIPSDRAPKGASKGDRVLLRDRLLNVRKQFGKPAGAMVGTDEGVLVLTSATSATFDGVTTLPGGTILLHGVFREGIGTYSVAGGTGRYAHARGRVEIGNGPSPLNTYRLTFAAASVPPVI